MNRGERGAAGLTALLCWALTMAVAVVVVLAATDLRLAAQRAQAAADSAALAAAGATTLGPAPASPHLAAQIAARLHGADLLRCCGDSGVLPPRIHVVTAVAPHSFPARALRPRVTAQARASLRPPAAQDP